MYDDPNGGTRDDVVVSFKPHTGYDAPLIAVKGRDAADVADKLGALEATGLFAIIAGADQAFRAAFNLGRELGATPVVHPQTAQQQYQQSGGYQGQPQTAGYPQGYPRQQAYPQQPPPQRGPAPLPPGLIAPNCPHGTKRYVEGQYGPFWGCPADRADPSHCAAELLTSHGYPSLTGAHITSQVLSIDRGE
jgi:hypothetical protein